MPLGTPLKTFVYDVGGGAPAERSIKAIQTGGPSGGCIPQEMFDTPVDYESLAQIGSIMGSGGMVVMDEDNCMVDVARYFVEFTHSESCGKCVPCRVGLDKALQILTDITTGSGTLKQLGTLDELCRLIRDTSLCGLGQSAPNPVLTMMRHFRHEFEEHIIAHRCAAGVCGRLALSPCENSCPLHMNIPRFLTIFKEGRLEDAFESVILDNPLPASTGRVCQHPCDDRCRRQTLDNEPVNMREVHRFIADSVYGAGRIEAVIDRILARRKPSSGHKVAIAGAGPAGLTAAFYLAMFGHDVTVYDANEEPGGMLRYAIPEYRLPKSVLEREIDLIRRVGVKFVGSTRIGTDVTVEQLESTSDAVFIALGAWNESRVKLPGAELDGVLRSLSFLRDVAQGQPPKLGRRMAVIGGGNAAIDSARTALRLGADVTVVYRRERKDMPAIAEETSAAELEGAKFLFLAAPHRILGDANGVVRGLEIARTRLGAFDASGRRKPVPTGEIVRLDCETVLLATGETFDAKFCETAGAKLNEAGTLAVDRFTHETSRKNVFAGGDLVNGPSNVTTAMSFGKEAARAIDQRLIGADRFASLDGFVYDRAVPEKPSPSLRHHPHELPVSLRVHGAAEVVGGLGPNEAREEASRCLRCDVCS